VRSHIEHFVSERVLNLGVTSANEQAQNKLIVGIQHSHLALTRGCSLWVLDDLDPVACFVVQAMPDCGDGELGLILQVAKVERV